MGGPRTQVKCLFKALIFHTYEKSIFIYSQMRFQLSQSHSMAAIRFNSGKKTINWVSVCILRALR